MHAVQRDAEQDLGTARVRRLTLPNSMRGPRSWVGASVVEAAPPEPEQGRAVLEAPRGPEETGKEVERDRDARIPLRKQLQFGYATRARRAKTEISVYVSYN